MNFKNETVELIFRRFKWTRNNTIELFQEAQNKKILSKNLKGDTKFEIKNILFQFQCILTTTDTYKRKITNSSNKSFGVIVINNILTNKENLLQDDIEKYLKLQIKELEEIFKNSDLENIIELIKIIDHEHMHHGELILLFRANNIDLPERFKRSWNL